jgi:hypothetical protein
MSLCVVFAHVVATHVSVVWYHVCVALRMYVCVCWCLALYQNFFTDADVVDAVCQSWHH